MADRTTTVGVLAALSLLVWASPGLGEGLGGVSECEHCKRLLAEGFAGSKLIDEATGRDLRHFAPDRPADFEHMRLEIEIPDMNERFLSARQRLDFTPLAYDLDVLSLNAEDLRIRDVRLSNGTARSLRFTYDERVLDIRFDPALPAGERASIEIEYELRDPADGLFWTTESEAWPGRPAQIHSQGQTETNRYWFPCHDFPNERLSTEIVVSVPDGFVASANGRLVSEKASRSGGTTFHWLQEGDHVNYLVTLVIGKFDVVDVAPSGSRFPMPVYAPLGHADEVVQTYGRTADMVEVFERRFGHPYPWDRYAQLIVWNFGAGGMENTSATTMYDTAIFDEKALDDGDLDGLISHELAHQWFGDLLTCNTWAHIWLNEGWATYATALWFEHRDGFDRGYLNSMYGAVRRIGENDRFEPGDTVDRPGMVSPVYEYPFETFRRVSNPYPKGASVLHMLRQHLGEEVFFDGVREYVNRFAHETVETEDFRGVLEEVSGRSLEQFFGQWCHRPGTPSVSVSAEWNEKRGELNLVVTQDQLIDSANPAFVFELPIVIESEGELLTHSIPVNEKRHERSIPLANEPGMVVVDPELSVLMKLTVDQPTKRVIEQALRGPTLPSRTDAARALAEEPGEETIAALVSCVRDEGEHYRVRNAAAASLGTLRAADELLAINRSGIDDARARIGVIRALAEQRSEACAGALAVHASNDNESYACRAAALQGLGEIGDPELHLEILIGALDVRSQHDGVRAGAVRGLAAMDTEACLGAVIPYTREGYFSRFRPVAIGAVATLAHHDEDAAFEAIAPLVFDREERARAAAGEALVKIESDRGTLTLEQMIASARTERWRERAEGWSDRLAGALSSEASEVQTMRELESLRRELNELKSKLETLEEK